MAANRLGVVALRPSSDASANPQRDATAVDARTRAESPGHHRKAGVRVPAWPGQLGAREGRAHSNDVLLVGLSLDLERPLRIPGAEFTAEFLQFNGRTRMAGLAPWPAVTAWPVRRRSTGPALRAAEAAVALRRHGRRVARRRVHRLRPDPETTDDLAMPATPPAGSRRRRPDRAPRPRDRRRSEQHDGRHERMRAGESCVSKSQASGMSARTGSTAALAPRDLLRSRQAAAGPSRSRDRGAATAALGSHAERVAPWARYPGPLAAPGASHGPRQAVPIGHLVARSAAVVVAAMPQRARMQFTPGDSCPDFAAFSGPDEDPMVRELLRPKAYSASRIPPLGAARRRHIR